MDVKKRIHDLRVKKGLTMEEVAKAVGVTKSAVQKWESGEIANMKRDKIAKLAEVLDCTPAYLMGWEDEPNSRTPLTREFVTNAIYKAIGDKPLTEDMLKIIISLVDSLSDSEQKKQ